ncbi:hypothetical protein E2C01_046085 [Portunus trituberculatus]|uniref:Uncharacterized protein n=1 Tax=Portunus trituberculatus TaxID=210409 RepID=A0A5B7FXH4_PORTR|nr:hypothetical protein [Portunus trituberculatus]
MKVDSLVQYGYGRREGMSLARSKEQSDRDTPVTTEIKRGLWLFSRGRRSASTGVSRWGFTHRNTRSLLRATSSVGSPGISSDSLLSCVVLTPNTRTLLRLRSDGALAMVRKADSIAWAMLPHPMNPRLAGFITCATATFAARPSPGKSVSISPFMAGDTSIKHQ